MLMERLRSYAFFTGRTDREMRWKYFVGIVVFSLLELTVFFGLLLYPIHFLSGSEIDFGSLVGLVLIPAWLYSLYPALRRTREILEESPDDAIKILRQNYLEEEERAEMHMESLRKLTLEYAKRKEAIDYTDLNLRLRETLLNVREAELDRREAVAAQVRAEANSNSFTGFSEAEI
jgi:hypothetical protein